MFKPSINYWDTGNRVRETGEIVPNGALARSGLVLLIHGYNNDKDEASRSYSRFLELLKKQRNVNANLFAVYWPGANWEGALYYMQAITQAQKVAPKLAKDLYSAAKAMGYLKIDIVAHSLGCRLTLETIRELLVIREQRGNLGGLVIGRVVFMAGAVPVKYLEDLQHLRSSLESFNQSLSLYSLNDDVLHWAFPAGQTAAGQGFFPVALGRKKWERGSFVYPPLTQKENRNAGHSDYWGSGDSNIGQKEFAAKEAADFLALGPSLPRTITPRNEPLERRLAIRKLTKGREVESRRL